MKNAHFFNVGKYVGILWAIFFIQVTFAQNSSWPDRPVKIIVPFAVGGATDIAARIIAPALSEQLGQQFFVEIKAGAAGNIALEHVAQSAPDGYTILIGNVSTNSINEILYASKLKVKPSTSFKTVALVASIPNILVSGPNFPPNNMKELVAYAKARPGELNFSSPLGGYSHLDMLDFHRRAGISMVIIPSKGAGDSQTGLISGNIHFSIVNAASSTTLIKAGKLKAFATTSANRLSSFPDLPTFTESGFGGVGSDQWNGLFVPAKTPPIIINKLHTALNQATQKLQIKEAFTGAGMTIMASLSQEEAQNFVNNEMQRWARIIKENQVNLE